MGVALQDLLGQHGKQPQPGRTGEQGKQSDDLGPLEAAGIERGAQAPAAAPGIVGHGSPRCATVLEPSFSCRLTPDHAALIS